MLRKKNNEEGERDSLNRTCGVKEERGKRVKTPGDGFTGGKRGKKTVRVLKN